MPKPPSPKIEKKRLDLLIVERGLAPSRQRAQALLLAGNILVDGQPASKAGTLVPADAPISLTGETLRYSSRGGLKLEGALEDFLVNPAGRTCLDAGSSNGGFTDCLLQHGAARVFAVDVNIAQLDWKLQRDPRVTTIEVNARYLKPQQISEPATLVTVDLSFISVAKVLPALIAAAPTAEFLILIKPQFELQRGQVGKGGIVRDRALQQQAIESVKAAAVQNRLACLGVRPSKLPGADGNLEFFLHARAAAV
jgi:23S rRNA (cytidine1920-2'-O)/16S rRNA (cytidine1409-2'-O)-methyltransferase